MAYLLTIFFVCVVAVCACIYLVRDEEYKVLLSLAKGTFSTLKKEWANIKKSAVIKFWRAKGQFLVGKTGKILLYNNKSVSILSFRVA